MVKCQITSAHLQMTSPLQIDFGRIKTFIALFGFEQTWTAGFSAAAPPPLVDTLSAFLRMPSQMF